MIDCKFITRQTDLKIPTYRLDVLDEIANAPTKGYDFEATGLDVLTLNPVLLGIIANNQKYVIDLTTYEPKLVGIHLQPIINNGIWIAHNAQYDINILQYHCKVDTDDMNTWDTMVASQVLYNGTDIENDYASLVAMHFKEAISKDQRKFFIDRDMSKPIELAEILYLEGDLHYLPMLWERQLKLLKAKNMLELMNDVENPLVSILSSMHIEGITLNTTKWMRNTEKYIAQRDEATQRLKESIAIVAEKVDLSDMFKNVKEAIRAKKQMSIFDNSQMYSNKAMVAAFNPRSTKQVASVLRKMKVFVPSTGAADIQKALIDYDEGIERTFMEHLLVSRKKEKLVSTYGTNFFENISIVDGKIHTSLGQAFTDTGRLNSRNPNLQNIPGEEEIRECFEADSDDHVLATLDFSGQELRIAAAYSKDVILLKSLNEGLDLHAYLAQGSYRIIKNDPTLIVTAEINPQYRKKHKNVLFGYIYGATEDRIAEVLNTTKAKAKLVMKWLIKAMPELAAYQLNVKEQAVFQGQMVDGSIYNRRKLFRTWKKVKVSDGDIERQGANYPIQATAATMSKEAMIKCHRYIKANGLHLRGGCIKLAVHDELVFQLHKDDAEYHVPKLKEIMINVGTSYLRGMVKMESSMQIARYWMK